MSESAVQGPPWDLSEEYAAPDSPSVAADLAALEALLMRIEEQNAGLAGAGCVAAARALHKLNDAAGTLLQNVSTYARCLLSVDSRDEAALILQARLKRHAKRFDELREPLVQFTMQADDVAIEEYLSDPETSALAFQVRHARKRRHEQLELAQENLVSALSQDGLHAWGALYGQLSGTLRCAVQRGNAIEEMGIAQASALLGSRCLEERRSAWQAINAAWAGHEETCAAAINAIAGWRLEMARKRGTRRAVHYLDAPVHASRITRGTLEALMAAAAAARPLARRAARAQARAYGRSTIGPWDQRAPAPALAGTDATAPIPFPEAVEIIAGAYAEIDARMGDVVRMMASRGWIEGRVSAHKRPGAFCTRFAKSRTPRVFMTYTGSASDVITLAHELGHAYHNWVMRDLPRCQTDYGMSLAETASIFGETLVRSALLARSSAPSQRLDIAWEEMSALVSFVLNIPTRFEFEKNFYERRAERPLNPSELKTLMSEAWTHWYGDVLAEPDPLFWASKLHFYISGLSFYNFPYLFGYLFSLGAYARREVLGTSFFERFNGMLRDTGRMTAEQLARAHLGVELDTPGFWEDTLAAIGPRVSAFESQVQELESAGRIR